MSRFQYIATSILIYDLYIDNIFALKNVAHTFYQSLFEAINLTPPADINKEVLNPKYNDAVFIIRKISQQHLNLTTPGIMLMNTLIR